VSPIGGSVTQYVGNEPAGLRLIVFEAVCQDFKHRLQLRVYLLLEKHGIAGDEPPGGLENLDRAATVLVQQNGVSQTEVVPEPADDLGISSCPREDGLFVVADSEETAMAFNQAPDDSVLIGIQILELIHEHIVPPRTQLGGRTLVGA
jgi:hypothetical protein